MAIEGTIRLLVRELARWVEPLGEAVANPFSEDSLSGILIDAGIDEIPSLEEIEPKISNIYGKLKPFLAGDFKPNLSLNDLKDLFALDTLLNGLSQIGEGNYEKLRDSLIINYLSNYQESLFDLLVLLGFIIDSTSERVADGQKSRQFSHLSIDFGAIEKFPSSPWEVVSKRYYGANGFRYHLFLERIIQILRGLGVSAYFVPLDESAISTISESSSAEFFPLYQVKIPLLRGVEKRKSWEIDIALSPVFAKENVPTGVAISFLVNGEIKEKIALSDDWFLDFNSTGEGQELGLKLLENGLSGPSFNNGSRGGSQFSIEFGVGRNLYTNEGVTIWKESGFGQLTLGSIGTQLDLKFDKGELISDLKFPMLDSRVAIDITYGDGFLKKILPEEGIEVRFDLIPGISTKEGFFIEGRGALGIERSIHKIIGTLQLYSVYLAVEFLGLSKFNLTTCLSGLVKLGPVDVSLDRVGVTTIFDLTLSGKGNLGFLNISPDFKSPESVGLVIKASGITGGGFLDFKEPDYSGALQLRFEKLGLAAIGLITAGGPQGFSMLINIGVEFSPPVQLSFGFRLSAVGGLIAINRTMSTEALQVGMANGNIDSLMFPRDPVGNAPALINQLKTVLPPEDRRYVVGPMLRLTWGPKNLIRADLGIFLEFPSPFKVLLLGQFEGTFPTKNQALIHVKVGILGLIDFGKKVLSIDARLYDSKILAWQLSGDMAVRLSWGKDPYFIISMGGFHPRYTVPSVYPPFLSPMKRLRLELGAGKGLNLSCETYLALSTNALQFGARADLYVKAGPAKVEGYIGFDTLIIFSPFSFEVDIQAGVSVRVKGRNVAGVSLAFVLSGPIAWRARGKAKIKILFFSFKVRFNVSWGRSEPPRIPGKDPLLDLLQILGERESWGGVLPEGSPTMEALQPVEAVQSAVQNGNSSTPPDLPLVVYPHGTLEVRQSLLPLGLRLKYYENAPVSGHDAFDITKITIGEQTFLLQENNSNNDSKTSLTFSPAQEYFARCQYFACSKKEKLSAPSFEKLDAGVVLGSAAVQIPPHDSKSKIKNFLEKASLQYESSIIDENRIKIPSELLVGRPVKIARAALTRGNSARRSGYRRDATLRYRDSQQVVPRVTLVHQPYQLAESTTLQPIDTEELEPLRFRNRGGMTRVEADAALAEYERTYPDKKGRFQVVSAIEVGV